MNTYTLNLKKTRTSDEEIGIEEDDFADDESVGPSVPHAIPLEDETEEGDEPDAY